MRTARQSLMNLPVSSRLPQMQNPLRSKYTKLAGRLVEACKEIVGLQDDNINVEFTQHKGDEMYHTIYGGLSDDWKAGEPDKLDQKISP